MNKKYPTNWVVLVHDASVLILMTWESLFFSSGTNLKLQNISVTLKMVKKVITNLDSSKAAGPDSIPMVVLKNCEPELSYITS